MTFGSEVARHLFHRLPTDKQVEVAHLESLLSKQGQSVQVDSVMIHENKLEIVIRISGSLKIS